MSLILPIIPHRSIGPFTLGSSLHTIITHIQHTGMIYRSIQMIWDVKLPLQTDIIMEVVDAGLRLHFDPISQRLRLITVTDLTKITLTYQDQACTGNVTPTFRVLYRIFGPTFPGEYDSSRAIYRLQYPGLCAIFPMSEFNPNAGMDLPLENSDGTSPICSRLFVHHGPTLTSSSLPPQLPSDTYFEPITVHLGRGIYLTKRRIFITFDSYAQDVLSDLGPPDSIYTPSSHAMSLQPTLSHDIIYNYFSLGFDIVISGITHRVCKLILHTNSLGRPDFNQYNKCNFRIISKSPRSIPGSPSLPSFSLLGPAAVSSTSTSTRATSDHPQTILHTIQSTSTPSSECQDENDRSTSPLPGGNSKKAKKARAQALAQAQAQTQAQAQSQTPVSNAPPSQPQPSPESESESTPITSPIRTNKMAKKQLLRDLSTKKKTSTSSPPSSLPVSASNSPRQGTSTVTSSSPPATSTSTSTSTPPSTSPLSSTPSPTLSSMIQPSQPIQYYDATPSPSSRSPEVAPIPLSPATAHPRQLGTRSPPPMSSSPSLSPSLSPSSDDITCDSRWPTIQRILGPPARPMVHNMSSRENPFGATFIYAYKGILCEVMRNEHLASITLFSDVACSATADTCSPNTTATSEGEAHLSSAIIIDADHVHAR